jgi:hypothetical protein
MGFASIDHSRARGRAQGSAVALAVLAIVASSLGCRTPRSAGPAAPIAAPAKPASRPAPARPAHGEAYWSVYFGAGCYESPELAQAKARARSAGFSSGHMDPNCNRALDTQPTLPSCPDDDVYVVASFFASEADARRVAATVPGVLWVGHVRTYCLD